MRRRSMRRRSVKGWNMTMTGGETRAREDAEEAGS